MSDQTFVQSVAVSAQGALAKAEELSHTIESDLPGTMAKMLTALHLAQQFMVAAHGMLSTFFPNNVLPHPTANGEAAVSAISPAIAESADASQ